MGDHKAETSGFQTLSKFIIVNFTGGRCMERVSGAGILSRVIPCCKRGTGQCYSKGAI